MENTRVNCQVNLNGTSAERLFDDWLEVYRAAHKLREALLLVIPHGRDYQTLPEWGAREQAHDRAMHSAMLVAARHIRTYAENSAIYLDEKKKHAGTDVGL